MKVVIINSSNLIMHSRQMKQSLDSINERIAQQAEEIGMSCEFVQVSGEGELVTAIQKAYDADGIILNAGDYAHYSIAIRDAISSIKKTPVIELHLTNVSASEQFRQSSMLSPVCIGVISGFGTEGYLLALDAFDALFNANKRKAAQGQAVLRPLRGGKHTA